MFQLRKEEPNYIYYKTHVSNDFKRACVTKKGIVHSDIELQDLKCESKVTEGKKADILKLFEKELVPQKHCAFYEELKVEEDKEKKKTNKKKNKNIYIL